jgi:hypothetical protein
MLHLEAVQSLIGEVRGRLAEAEKAPSLPEEQGSVSEVSRRAATGPQVDPAAHCGFG